MAKWEYQIIVCTNDYSDNTSLLNGMGKDGWELVSAVNRPTTTNYAPNSHILNIFLNDLKKLEDNYGTLDSEG